MRNNAFEEPVTIMVGLSFPTAVETVAEAYAILAEWPGRDPAHGVAIKACKAALDGDIDPETARGTFVAFAQRTGILVPEGDAVLAARATGSFEQRLPA